MNDSLNDPLNDSLNDSFNDSIGSPGGGRTEEEGLHLVTAGRRVLQHRVQISVATCGQEGGGGGAVAQQRRRRHGSQLQ